MSANELTDEQLNMSLDREVKVPIDFAKEGNPVSIRASNEESFQKLADLAHLLGIKYETILDWTKRDDFPTLRLPSALRVRASDVAKWLEQFQNPSVKETK